jgi:hypothetical protein
MGLDLVWKVTLKSVIALRRLNASEVPGQCDLQPDVFIWYSQIIHNTTSGGFAVESQSKSCCKRELFGLCS